MSTTNLEDEMARFDEMNETSMKASTAQSSIERGVARISKSTAHLAATVDDLENKAQMFMVPEFPTDAMTSPQEKQAQASSPVGYDISERLDELDRHIERLNYLVQRLDS